MYISHYSESLLLKLSGAKAAAGSFLDPFNKREHQWRMIRGLEKTVDSPNLLIDLIYLNKPCKSIRRK